MIVFVLLVLLAFVSVAVFVVNTVVYARGVFTL